MTETAAVVWRGAEALRPFLVLIGELEPFPGNPRLGDVQAVRSSLRRFGQTRAILIDAEDGRRIVAGHHVVLAATAEGWSHVAAIPNEFESEDEARAYLLADNRTSELGNYDLELLNQQLIEARDTTGGLAGTGYSLNDLDAQLAELRSRTVSPPSVGSDGTKREHRDPGIKELVLNYSTAQLEQVEIWMGIVAQEKGTAGTSETIYSALEVAARTLNAE